MKLLILWTERFTVGFDLKKRPHYTWHECNKRSAQNVSTGDFAQVLRSSQNVNHDQSEQHGNHAECWEGLHNSEPRSRDPREQHSDLGREKPPTARVNFSIKIESVTIQVEADLPQSNVDELLRFKGLPPTIRTVGCQIKNKCYKGQEQANVVDYFYRHCRWASDVLSKFCCKSETSDLCLF